jgi:hypothetical protein
MFRSNELAPNVQLDSQFLVLSSLLRFLERELRPGGDITNYILRFFEFRPPLKSHSCRYTLNGQNFV